MSQGAAHNRSTLTSQPANRRHSFSGGILWILPGKGGIYFAVHRDLILASSKYFKRVTLPGTDRRSMPDATSEVVNSYINWLYMGTVCNQEPTDPHPSLRTPPREDPEYIRLAELYNFGIKVEDARFTDVVTDAFVTRLREKKLGYKDLPGAECVNLIFAANPYNDPSYDPMARLVLEAYVREGKAGDLDGMKSSVDARFLQELSSKLLEKRDKPVGGVALLDKCTFHAHTSSKSCGAEKQSSKRRRIEE